MSAGVILVDREGRVLMQLRDDNPKIMYPNHWGLTGGAALPGETPDQAARREVTEETGLTLEGMHPFRA
jgi:8-oxo-dGTP pyrophosphatase MutT (NUDIX family)